MTCRMSRLKSGLRRYAGPACYRSHQVTKMPNRAGHYNRRNPCQLEMFTSSGVSASVWRLLLKLDGRLS